MSKHTHQYKKVKLKKASVYRCMLSGCPHYVLEHLILGRQSLCPSCKEVFTIDKYASKRTNPICQDCRNTKEPVPESSEGFFADILKDS